MNTSPMNAWGDEEPPTVQAGSPKHRMRGRHIVIAGLLVAVSGAVPAALGIPTLGPMLLVLGILLASFGAAGWCMELLGWDGDEDGSDSARLLDIVRLPTRVRRH
jgi:hypothetical protein